MNAQSIEMPAAQSRSTWKPGFWRSGLRGLVWMLVHFVYRMRIVGHNNIPAKGGALLVCNHLSFVDAFLLAGSTERHVRFLIYKGFYDRPLIGLFARAVGAIAISSEQRPRDMIRSLRIAGGAIRDGEVDCSHIFGP